MSFSNKVVLITGASSGIGASTAVEFAKLGADLVLTGRNVENLKKTEEQCIAVGPGSLKILLVQADVTKDEDVKNILAETIQKFGKLDVLVNNAGIYELGSIEETTIEQYEKIFATNVRAVYYTTTLAVPHLVKTKGNIVNVSSLAGLRSFPGVVAYCMSKAALDQFTRCVALDLAPKQVRVNSVNPAVILTDIFRRSGMSDENVQELLKVSNELHPLGRYGQPEEVAKLIVFLASDDSSFITGETVSIAGGRQISCPSASISILERKRIES